MRNQLVPSLGSLFFYSLLLIACDHKKAQQFNVDLTMADGSTESHALFANSMLLVNDGDMHVVAKVISGTESDLELQVSRYTVTLDSIKGEHTIQKTATNTNTLTKGNPVVLDHAGTVQVKLQSTTTIGERQGTTAGCNGICCEATCYSVYCCGDTGSCKDAPCDCKGPSNCPGTQTALSAQFFEVYKSGKEMMVFKI